jgi:hypothetical protein
MKLRLLQNILELNEAFDQVIQGLMQMEKVRAFPSELIRYARAEVEIARVHTNREFFSGFEGIVQSDARWAYKFQRDFDRKLKDPDDIYLEIKESEERRRKKGLPPRLVLLPNWDMSDEDRYDEEEAKRRKRTARKRKNKMTRRSRTSTTKPLTRGTNVRPTSERKAES